MTPEAKQTPHRHNAFCIDVDGLPCCGLRETPTPQDPTDEELRSMLALENRLEAETARVRLAICLNLLERLVKAVDRAPGGTHVDNTGNIYKEARAVLAQKGAA